MLEAVARGADRSNIERAINAGRAADVTGIQKKNVTESDRQQEAYERTRTRRSEHTAKASEPAHRSWQERERERQWERER